VEFKHELHQGRFLCLSAFSLFLFLFLMSIFCRNAYAERVQGGKWYLADQVGYFPTLAQAADIHIKKFCSGAVKDCGNFRDEEVYDSSYASWMWKRYFTYTTTNSVPGKYYETMVSGFRRWDCPGQFSMNNYSGVCTRPDPPEPSCDCNAPRTGNPILPSTGTKEQVEVDYIGSGSNSLRFVRTYRSHLRKWAHNYQMFALDFASLSQNPSLIQSWPEQACYNGVGATTGKASCYVYIGPRTGKVNDFSVMRGNDRILSFGTDINFAPKADINDRVTKITDAAGVPTGWQVYNAATEKTERYDLSGRLRSIAAHNGQVLTLTYSDANAPPSTAPGAGFLTRVTDQFGRQLNFTYDASGRMVTMTDPTGGVYQYAYDEVSSFVKPGKSPGNNLTSVTYPDGKKRIYWYNEQDKTENTDLPNFLTGITDENGVRYATYTYDFQGGATSTQHAGGVEKYSVSYPSERVQSKVTDPLGAVRTFNFQTILGVVKNTSQSQPAGAGSNAVSSSITYDANGNVASRTDFNGNKICYDYDLTRNLETVRLEGLTSSATCSSALSATSLTGTTRKITTQWHAQYRMPTLIAEPNRLSTFSYDSNGNLLSRTEQATTDPTGGQGTAATTTGAARAWRYTYNDIGLMLTATDARGASTTYTYDEQGNLATKTNAVGHVTTLSDYDANGRAGKIVGPDGVSTELVYSPRGQLISRTVAGETIGYEYDSVGQLKQLTLADGAYLTYSYDDAHRLIGVTDSMGNTIRYTLDTMGNRVKEEIKDSSGVLARQIISTYDALSRLQEVTGGVQ
jgi:YD repeat-containing protein